MMDPVTRDPTLGGMLQKSSKGSLFSEPNLPEEASKPYLYLALVAKQTIKDVTYATLVKLFNKYDWVEIESRRRSWERKEFTGAKRPYESNGLCGEECQFFPAKYRHRCFLLAQYYEVWTINQTLESYFSVVEWKKIETPEVKTQTDVAVERGTALAELAGASISAIQTAGSLGTAAPQAGSILGYLGTAAGVEGTAVATASTALGVVAAGVALFVGATKVYDALDPSATHKLEGKGWTVAGFVPGAPNRSIKTAVTQCGDELEWDLLKLRDGMNDAAFMRLPGDWMVWREAYVADADWDRRRAEMIAETDKLDADLKRDRELHPSPNLESVYKERRAGIQIRRDVIKLRDEERIKQKSRLQWEVCGELKPCGPGGAPVPAPVSPGAGEQKGKTGTGAEGTPSTGKGPEDRTPTGGAPDPGRTPTGTGKGGTPDAREKRTPTGATPDAPRIPTGSGNDQSGRSWGSLWAILAVLLGGAIITMVVARNRSTTGGSASSAPPSSAATVTGGSGTRMQYFLDGTITSRSGCEGEFFNAAPKPGGTHNLLEEMWLSDGILHSTNGGGYSSEYTGTLSKDGSFHLVWTTPSPGGEKGRIDGQLSADGAHITGTWDWVFTSGCVNHMRITDGHFLSNGRLAPFVDAPVR